MNGVPQWLEIGIVRDANDPRYIVYTWDSDDPEDSKWQSHFETDPYQWHTFEIYVLPYNSTHSTYIILWDEIVLRTGYNVIDVDECQVDQVHEAFAESEDSFEGCDSSYFKESSIFIWSTTEMIPWNDDISTGFYALYPMFERHWLELINGNEYWRFETWIDAGG